MSAAEPDPEDVDVAAKRLKNRFGESANVYAESRAEAAELAGEKDDAERWEQVADSLGEDDRS